MARRQRTPFVAIRDWGLCAVIAGVVVVCAFIAASRVAPYALHYSTFDFWFESDPPAFLDQMQDREADHHFRTRRHPLWSLLLYPTVNVLAALVRTDVQTSIVVVMSLAAAAWASMVFIILRLIGAPRLDAMVFTTLATVSGAGVFWLPMPETYSIGSVGMLAAVGLVALEDRGLRVPWWAFLASSMATLAITTTNWVVGLFAQFVSRRWGRAALIVVATLVLMHVALDWQRQLFRYAGSPLDVFMESETKFLLSDHSGGFGQKALAFWFHAIVMPEVTLSYGYRLSVQNAGPATHVPLGLAGTLLWSALLVVAARGLASVWRSPTALLLLGSVAAHFLLAMAFGIETFMYSLHWVPLVVILCAYGTLGAGRRIALSIAVALTLVAGANNISMFVDAASALESRYETERAFTRRVAETTGAGDLILCGRHAAAALGEPTAIAGRDPDGADIEDIGRYIPTDGCHLGFGNLQVPRRGWVISYEDWTVETVERFRQRGARYFVTPYAWGLEHDVEFFDALDVKYTRIERTPQWAFYELVP